MSDPNVDFPLISLEEKALKAKLQGLTVYDLENSTRPVKVFYRNPQKEIVEGDFPFLTILFTGLARSIEREHRSGFVMPGYIPHPLVKADEISGDAALPFHANEQAIPFDLNFVVATHTRIPQHDRQIIVQLLGINYLPLRYGWLECEDNTIRRLDVNPTINSNDFYDQSGSQIFRKEFRVTVSTETWAIMPTEDDRIPSTVTQTFVDIDDYAAE